MGIELKTVAVEKPAEASVIIGQTHFIKSAEDLHSAMTTSSAAARFGLAFCEASGDCLVRVEGNDEELKTLAAKNALAIGAGHSFLILLKDAYAVNVLNAVKCVPEVCTVFCATANDVEVIVAETQAGRGILGVIDGKKPSGVETPDTLAWRRELLKKLGYKP